MTDRQRTRAIQILKKWHIITWIVVLSVAVAATYAPSRKTLLTAL